MRKNKDTIVKGKRVTLVPYKKEHVLRYHKWMQDEELQQLTASEPLTLEQEYEMQQSWFIDEDKCTFIVLDAEVFQKTGNETEAMVGDVNLFLNDPDDRTAAEVEIMIAEPSARGKGVGKEATLAMMKYGISFLNIKEFSVKIGFDNKKSTSMFSKFGFQEMSRSDVFREVTMKLPLTDQILQEFQTQTSEIQIIESPEPL